MYPKLQSKAIFLYSYPLREADKGFILFTERFGLLHAKATSLRKEDAKLKSGISSYTLLDLTLLRGKAGWRLLEISSTKKPVSDFSTAELRGIYKLFKIVLQNIAQEEPNRRLFDILESLLFLGNFFENQNTSRDLMAAASHDILAALGYTDASLEFVKSHSFNTELFKLHKDKVLQNLQRAKNRSHVLIDLSF